MRVLAATGAVAVGASVLAFHPSRPLYMNNDAVEFVAADGVVLHGTLSSPRWSRQPAPGIVLVHGSGRLTRDHVVGDVRRLVWLGFAVLAYDKRGVGASGGVYEQRGGDGAEATLRRLAADAARAFDALAATVVVDRERLGFFGASQAGWVIPLAAGLTRRPPRFNVILSGPAVSTGVEQYYSDMTGDGIRAPRVTDHAEVERLTSSYKSRSGFDPSAVLSANRIPTLWLLGRRDESVPTFASVQVLDGIRATGNDSHTVVVYAAAGHALRDVDTGRPAPIWDDMMRWLRERGVLAASR
jgi:dipeptidyl aminopeptidase/acylaminoacyl peptidase